MIQRKRWITLLLAGALALTAAACAGQQDASAPGSAAPAASPAASAGQDAGQEAEDSLLVPGQTVSGTEWDLAVIGSDLFSQNTRGVWNWEPPEEEDDGQSDALCVVYLGVKSTAKSAVEVPQDLLGKLEYGDGYEYDPSGSGYLKGISWVGTDKGTLATLDPLSDALLLEVHYKVPRAVMEDTSAPLNVTFHVDGADYTFVLRPGQTGGEVSDLAAQLQALYDQAWLIHNIGYYGELAYDNVAFAWKYAGNVNAAGERRFSDEYLQRLTASLDPIYAYMDSDAIAALLPETAAALQVIQSHIDNVAALLNTLGDTNSEADVQPVVDAAWEGMVAITDMLDLDEMLQFGRFAGVQGRLSAI